MDGTQLDTPVYGAIGVQVNASGVVTHVGFYAGETGIVGWEVNLLGGNQGGGTQMKYSNAPLSSFTYWCLPPGYGSGN